MKVLIACEYSATIREAFKNLGADAWSCDLLASEKPGNHYRGNVLDILCNGWELLIAHPPCTRLCNSGWWYVKQNNLHREVKQAAAFFNKLLKAPVERICIENPIHSPAARLWIRKQDQIIQPYNFGNDASKQTCLWLKNLPPLQPTAYAAPRIVDGKKRWSNQTDGGWNKMPPSVTRGQERSRSFAGVAAAMASQWINLRT